MAQALKKYAIKSFAKTMTLAPIFWSQNYFRWKYLDVISFTVSLSVYIWVRVENSLLQQLNCQRISCNSNRLRKGCESNKGDQLTRALKKGIQEFLPWSRLWKYLENICIFQMSNSQWRAAGIKLLFSGFFQNRIQSFCMPSFKSIWPALQVFSQTNPKNTPNTWLFWQRKTFGTKFG